MNPYDDFNAGVLREIADHADLLRSHGVEGEDDFAALSIAIRDILRKQTKEE